MPKKPIYTIGHGTRAIDVFIQLLKKYDIHYLADVRSRPYSRFNPQYNKERLAASLQQEGITYVFMGDTLGGRPADPHCYDVEGKVDYERIKKKDFYRQGIERLQTAYAKDVSMALMCSESKPSHCHRTKLIGQTLDALQITLQHIDEKGELKTQAAVMKEVNSNPPGHTLFNDEQT
jgi:uncharacterized protein (DUF488 family)